MWGLLRDHRLSQFKLRRQVPFENDILDFVCFERRLVIEMMVVNMHRRKPTLSGMMLWHDRGGKVLRYWNSDVVQRRTAVL